jgi:hypothetical protein
MNSQILEKVEASGVCGIKKAELKKIFGTECDSSLEALAKEEKIIVDNKGIAHYVWSRITISLMSLKMIQNSRYYRSW